MKSGSIRDSSQLAWDRGFEKFSSYNGYKKHRFPIKEACAFSVFVKKEFRELMML